MDAFLRDNKEVIQAAVLESTKAVEDAGVPPFVVTKTDNSRPKVIVPFTGSWSPDDWFTGVSEAKPFGETDIDDKKFPSLRSLGNDKLAMVNDAFKRRFLALLEFNDGSFCKEVEKVKDEKQIIFAGHSSGGPIAIYATVWFLEKYKRQEGTFRPLCLTFGSPVTTDRTFGHAIRREGWSDCFVHFVMQLDIVPRILLAPLSSTRDSLEKILPLLNPRPKPDSIDKEKMESLYKDVMKNASCVANYAACELTGSKHSLSDTMSRFIKLSPYRPCGKYVICTKNGGLVVVENPDAVLQLLYYSSLQIEPKIEHQEKAEPKTELQEKAKASLNAHWTYKDALDESLKAPQRVVCLDDILRELPLSSGDAALNDLNLCAPARLCLRAAGELEQKKLDNQKRIKGKMDEIEKDLIALENYRKASKEDGTGYYDAFKLQEKEGDFKANVMRLELAAIWDEIIQMVRQRELPDGFEMKEEWVKLGTRFRHLAEPTDIANYYRHGREVGSGPYLRNGRPSRYKYTQKWQEHAEQSPKVSYCESSFWAEVEELPRELEELRRKDEELPREVEELRRKVEELQRRKDEEVEELQRRDEELQHKVKELQRHPKKWEEVKDRVKLLGERLEKWYGNESDVFLKKSTLYVCWQTLRKDLVEPRSLLLVPIPLAE